MIPWPLKATPAAACSSEGVGSLHMCRGQCSSSSRTLWQLLLETALAHRAPASAISVRLRDQALGLARPRCQSGGGVLCCAGPGGLRRLSAPAALQHPEPLRAGHVGQALAAGAPAGASGIQDTRSGPGVPSARPAVVLHQLCAAARGAAEAQLHVHCRQPLLDAPASSPASWAAERGCRAGWGSAFQVPTHFLAQRLGQSGTPMSRGCVPLAAFRS